MLRTLTGLRSRNVSPPRLSKRIVVTEPKVASSDARSRRTSYDVDVEEVEPGAGLGELEAAEEGVCVGHADTLRKPGMNHWTGEL